MRKLALVILASLMVIGGAFAMPHGQNNSPHGWHPGHVQGDWLNPNSWLGQQHNNHAGYGYVQYTGSISYNGISFQYYVTGNTMHVDGVTDRNRAHHIAHIAFDFKPNIQQVVFDDMGIGYKANEHRGHGWR